MLALLAVSVSIRASWEVGVWLRLMCLTQVNGRTSSGSMKDVPLCCWTRSGADDGVDQRTSVASIETPTLRCREVRA